MSLHFFQVPRWAVNRLKVIERKDVMGWLETCELPSPGHSSISLWDQCILAIRNWKFVLCFSMICPAISFPASPVNLSRVHRAQISGSTSMVSCNIVACVDGSRSHFCCSVYDIYGPWTYLSSSTIIHYPTWYVIIPHWTSYNLYLSDFSDSTNNISSF